MYKHVNDENEDEDEENEDDNMEVANIDEETVNNIEADETSMTVNKTFLNPSNDQQMIIQCTYVIVNRSL